MLVSDAIEDYRYAKGSKSSQTQLWYKAKLKCFAQWCEQEQLTMKDIKPAHIRRYLDYRRKQYNPITGKLLSTYTLHGDAQVIKGFLNWCAIEYEFEGLAELERVANRIEMPSVEKKVIEVFTPEQINALLSACGKQNDKYMVARDRAILQVLFDTGIRAGELCNLTFDCTFLRPDDAYLKVHGKRDKWREVGLGNEARTALVRYTTRFRRAPRDENHVFVGRFGFPMTVGALDQLFSRLEKRAHIEGVRCSPHTCRHTFAMNFLASGGDFYKLKRLMGHDEASTTEVYTRAYEARTARQGNISYMDTMQRRDKRRKRS